jgi:methylmalonyl-CoA carboxyltransferase large subunit
MSSEVDVPALLKRLEQLEMRVRTLEGGASASPAIAAVAAARAAANAPAPAPEELSEELLTVLSAAIAAFLGVKARIRQIRLAGREGWAQQGRASIMASHRLAGRG